MKRTVFDFPKEILKNAFEKGPFLSATAGAFKRKELGSFSLGKQRK